MSDTDLKNMKVAVVGGGVTGLAAAYHLVNNGVNVTIYESGETLGGQV
ncbi:MAG TPA: FAD-dependent oxidoreductase, partial [Dehalococcoidia bacterium]|nr:FAD-dependent oxidoreductase [Dehalococcoidia bacterium]